MDRCLTEIERKKITELYESRYKQYGHNHKTVGWGSETDQILRFDILCKGLDLKGKSILDVGCGLGDLVPYLEIVTGGDFHYTGIDLAPALVTSAQEEFQQSNVQFKCSEMSSFSENEHYDIALLSGALNYRIEDNIGNTEIVLDKLFRITKESVAVNFLSDYVDYQEKKNFHYSPEDMFRYAKLLSRWVAIYHDYPLWEFTIQIHHNSIK